LPKSKGLKGGEIQIGGKGTKKTNAQTGNKEPHKKRIHTKKDFKGRRSSCVKETEGGAEGVEEPGKIFPRLVIGGRACSRQGKELGRDEKDRCTTQEKKAERRNKKSIPTKEHLGSREGEKRRAC